jgi:mono/diheme cytochrome c family protein
MSWPGNFRSGGKFRQPNFGSRGPMRPRRSCCPWHCWPATARRARRDAVGPVQPDAQLATTTTVIAGAAPPAASRSAHRHFETSAFHVSEGQRLYTEFNCVECHAHGGGGIGPALIDDEWVYGSSSPQIVATLIQGRPNGMPSFRRMLTESRCGRSRPMSARWRRKSRRMSRPAARHDGQHRSRSRSKTSRCHDSNGEAGSR